MRRAKSRFALCIVVLLCGFAAAGWGQSPLKMSAAAGFGGHAKPGRWMPVRVTVENDEGTATQGTLTLRFVSDYRRTQFYTPADLPNHSRKQFFLYSLADDNNQGVVMLNVRGVRPVPINIHLDGETDQLVLVVSSEGEGGLSYVAGLRGVGRPLVGSPGRYYGPPIRSGQGSATHVVYASPGELPDRWIGYDPLNVVVLQNFSPRDFTQEQVTALRTWVAGGGTLVVSGGSNYQRLMESFVADMLPVQVAGSKVLSAAPQLTAHYGSRLWGGAPLVVSTPAPRAQRSGQVIVEQDGIPLVAAREFGAGHVVYLAFDPAKPPIAGWEGSHELWRDVLTWAGDCPVMVSAYEESRYYGGGYRPMYQQTGTGSLSAALMNIPSMQAPPFGFIGMFLLVYIVCLVPINYFALKRLGKRELAWVTTPFIVLIFTFLSYGVGFSIKGGTLRVNKLTIVQSQAGAGWGVADTLFGIFSPSKTGYTLAAADGIGAVSDLVPESYSTEQSSLTVSEGQQMAVEDYRINMWAMKLFRARSVVNLGKGVTAQFSVSNGALRATVRNGTPYDFRAATLVAGQLVTTLNALTAGATTTVQLPTSPASGVSLAQQLPATLRSAQGDNQQDNLRTAALQSLLDDEFSSAGMNLLAQGALFVGWTAQEELKVNVAGRTPTVEQSTLVVVRLPLDLPSLPSTDSEMLVPGRIIASANLDELSRQSPGAVQLDQSQELFYEFRLPIRRERVRLSRLYVKVDYSGQSPRLNAYNVANHRYEPLDENGSGNPIYLSPAHEYLRRPDGVVRVRVTAKGQTQLSGVHVGFRSR